MTSMAMQRSECVQITGFMSQSNIRKPTNCRPHSACVRARGCQPCCPFTTEEEEEEAAADIDEEETILDDDEGLLFVELCADAGGETGATFLAASASTLFPRDIWYTYVAL